MLVLPYYLHDYKAFGRITVLGEFLAVAAVVMCVLFVFVDLGQPSRVMNVLLHPAPNSILFWDMVVLSGYLLINIFSGWVILSCNRKEIPPPGWVQADYLFIHSLGDQHSHGHRFHLRRPAGTELLAHRHHGAAVPRFGFRFGPCAVDSSLPDSEAPGSI